MALVAVFGEQGLNIFQGGGFFRYDDFLLRFIGCFLLGFEVLDDEVVDPHEVSYATKLSCLRVAPGQLKAELLRSRLEVELSKVKGTGQFHPPCVEVHSLTYHLAFQAHRENAVVRG